MDIIKTRNQQTPMNVIFDGRYIFIESFSGIVAVAHPILDENYDVVGYSVEHTLSIDQPVIARVIRNHRKGSWSEGIRNGKYKIEYETSVHVGCLPYKIEIKLSY